MHRRIEPVRRQDPEGAVAQIRVESRAGLVAKRGRDKGQKEEECPPARRTASRRSSAAGTRNGPPNRARSARSVGSRARRGPSARWPRRSRATLRCPPAVGRTRGSLRAACRGPERAWYRAGNAWGSDSTSTANARLRIVWLIGAYAALAAASAPATLTAPSATSPSTSSRTGREARRSRVGDHERREPPPTRPPRWPPTLMPGTPKVKARFRIT